MKDKKDAKAVARRDFFRTATVGAGAAGAAALGLTGTKAAAKSAPASATGYRETEHVKKVYALARF
ncbi:MAG: formate dehydrogenase [Alphaproteobacteria bacterium]|nr:formate dehydrogenase [Alphaproteobacteria bacterium]